MSHDSNILAEIADDFTDRLRTADQPTVEEYVERHPEFADQLRKLLPSIRAMEQLSSREHTERRFEHQTKKLTLEPDGLLGDFRIIREIGRGGMGVIYEAEQQSLKRRVALKVLGPAMAGSARQLQRFKSEAYAAASLHHTNIVSVYGVGEHEGLNYYAMQLIDGITLNDAIAAGTDGGFLTMVSFSPERDQFGDIDADASSDVPTDDQTCADGGADPSGDFVVSGGARWVTPSPGQARAAKTQADRSAAGPLTSSHQRTRWNEIARIGACVADALDYAHRNGVLHRDVKPSNLMIDTHGVVWITDFGLARHEDFAGVTASGDIVGTLRYMAPEQFSGKVDGRSDIYSLGLTIYEMLTLQPAFPEARHAPLVHQKTMSAPPPPTSICAEIPRDLETIVLKACAPDPKHRYPTAAALAEDLHRFLDDRPIEARRVTLLERLWRWSRRNPTTAALSLSTAVLLVFAAAVFAIANFRLNDSYDQLQDERLNVFLAKLEAKQEKALVEENLLEASDTLDWILSDVDGRILPDDLVLEVESDPLTPPRHPSAPDIQILTRQRAYFEDFAVRNHSRVPAAAARAWHRVAGIDARMARFDSALAAFQTAADLFRTLGEQDLKSIDYVIQGAASLRRAGDMSARRGDFTAAQTAYDDATRRLKASPGIVEMPVGQYELALIAHARHVTFLRAHQLRTLTLPTAAPAAGDVLTALAAENAQAIDNLSRLVADQHADGEPRRLLARLLVDRARLAWLGSPDGDADQSLRQAALLLNELCEDQPNSLPLRYELGWVLCLCPLETPPQSATIESLHATADLLREVAATSPHSQLFVTWRNRLSERLDVLRSAE